MPELDDQFAADFSAFSPTLRQEIVDAPLPPLDAGSPAVNLESKLESLAEEDLGPLSGTPRQLCLSGLWLLAGDLDRSHTISQAIGSAEGSFWHGIMHRREGDFGNSKYWFGKVGDHPVFDQLRELDDNYHDPFEFVDQCSHALRGREQEDCKLTQWLEWQLLMSHCIKHAVE